MRIDPGDPNAEYPSGQVDHVSVTFEGEKLDANGNPIKPTAEYPKPSKNPDAHIPVSVWQGWSSWFKP